MNTITLYHPKKLSVGENVYMQISDDLLAIGCRRLYVVTGDFMMKQLESLIIKLQQAGIEFRFHTTLKGEPTFDDFYAITADAQDFGADSVAGIGGGSVLDVAKMVAALYNRASQLESVVGIGLLKERDLPLFCVPTTAGTGSEMSPNSILLDTRDNSKKGIISPVLVPDYVYIDAVLTLDLPPQVTAFTGLDALTHCIEAYCNKNAHPMVDTFALLGIKLIGQSLLKAVKNGHDLEARTNLALGSMYGGMCLGPVNTAAVHALAYPLGTEFHLAHGLSNAVLLPFVMAFNLDADVKRYSEVAEALGIVHGGSYRETAESGIDFLKELIAECGLPTGLKQLGITPNDFGRLADGALKVQRLLKNNLKEITYDDAKGIYELAW